LRLPACLPACLPAACLPVGRVGKYSRTIGYIFIRLLSYFTCIINVLFSSLHFAKIIKALLYAKKFLTGYVGY
jgi:hypothetical protein